jgi:hypothetical protein
VADGDEREGEGGRREENDDEGQTECSGGRQRLARERPRTASTTS